MSKYGTFATLLHYWAKSVLLKNLQRWRAADSRPYTADATESPSGNFGAFVGVVPRAANQNPMIAGGDHTIIQRLLAARLFPRGGKNVGAKRRQYIIEHFAVKFGGAEGKSVGTRRRSRPWLPLWGSWHGASRD